MAKTNKNITFVETMSKFYHAGIEGSLAPNRLPMNMDGMASIDERIEKILGVVNDKSRSASRMLFFVMYDITSNKVRNQVVKYLIKKGCTRIQRSIFLADLESSVYEQIKSDLTEVQAAYENYDSILVVPISTDYLKAMRVIGQSIEIDVITHSKNTLFF